MPTQTFERFRSGYDTRDTRGVNGTMQKKGVNCLIFGNVDSRYKRTDIERRRLSLPKAADPHLAQNREAEHLHRNRGAIV